MDDELAQLTERVAMSAAERSNPLLRVISSASSHSRDDSVPPAGWRTDANEIWRAWRGLEDWDDVVEARFDRGFGRHLLVLWALYTFRGGSPEILGELVADDLEPRFGDPVVEDMVRVAFALGASWAAADRPAAGRAGTALRRTVPRFRVHPGRPA